MAEYYNVTTNLGDAEIAAAITNNAKIQITHIAFGDGAGSVPTPSKTRTTLVREVHRQAVTKYERHPTNLNWIVIETIIPSDIGGFTIREMGIIGNGKLLSHGSHAPFEKVADPSGVSEYRLKFTQNITDGNVVSITLDDSLIYATQAWVEENFIKRSEIVNNLTTDDETKPVSAKQAKKLQDEKLSKTSNLSDLQSASSARTNLGLGTAATLDAGSLQGQVMRRGAFGVGNGGTEASSNVVSGVNGANFNNYATIPGGFGVYDSAAINKPIQFEQAEAGVLIQHNGGWAGFLQIAAPTYYSTNPRIYCRTAMGASPVLGTWRFFRDSLNTTTNANGYLVPSSPVIQIHAESFVLNDDAKTLKAECVKFSIGHYEISNVDGFHQEGWYINTPTDRNQNPLIAIEYNFDAEQRKITINSYAVKPGVFPFEPDLSQPMDAPEGRWIDVRLYEPAWLNNSELPPVSEIIQDKNGNIAPSQYHILENEMWIISDEDALKLTYEKRESMRPLTRRQFKLALLENGLLDQIENSISAIEDDQTRARIQIEYTEATEFHRTSDSVMYMCQLLNLNDDQVDQMWTEALNL